MFNKLKQFRDMRNQAKELKNKMAGITESATAYHSQIHLTVDGNLEIIELIIDEGALGNKEKLASELKNVINETIQKVQKKMTSDMMKDGSLGDLMNMFKQ